MWSHTLVPFAFIYADNLTVLHTDTAIGKEIWRIGKYTIKLEIKFAEQLATITVKKGKVTVGRFKIRFNHYLHQTRCLIFPPTYRV